MTQPAHGNLPGGSLFANPYGEEFYIFLTTDGSGTSTVNVFSGLDTLLLTQQSPAPLGSVYIPPEQNLNVWGDTVVVDPLALPGRSVTIWAQTVQWTNAAHIDVSGSTPTPAVAGRLKIAPAPNGPDNDGNNSGQPGIGGATGASGNTAPDAPDNQAAYTPTPGMAAGTITIYAAALDDRLAPGSPLTLRADGGAGGNGQDAQAGQDGGHGGNGKAGVNNGGVRTNSWPSWPSYPPIAGGNGGGGGAGGNGGNAANGASGGSITIATLTASPTAQVATSVNGGAGGAGGAGGNGGNGGNAGWGPPDLSATVAGTSGTGGNAGSGGSGGAAGTIHWAGVTPATSTAGGAAGAAGAAGNPGAAGAPNGTLITFGGNTPPPMSAGAAGSASSLGSYDYSTLAGHASSLQCSMMLQKANLHYLSADPASAAGFNQAAAVANWLQAVTYPIVQAAPAAPDPDQTILIDVYSHARAMASQLHLRHDYYGNLFTYVPRVSYSTQQALLNQMIAAFQGTEQTYVSYFNQLQTTQSTYDQVVGQASATSSQVTATRSQLDALVPATQQLVKTLDVQLQELETAARVMDQKIASYRSDLEAAARRNGCAMAGIGMMKKVVGTFAGAVTGGGAAAKFAGQETTAAVMIPLNDAAADFGNQNDVISKVEVLLQRIHNLAQVYAQNPNEVDAGTFKLLITDQKALQQMLTQYTNVLPDSADGKAALDSIKHFIQVAQQRNVYVIQYNANLARYVALKATLVRLNAQLQQVQNLTRSANPALPWIVAFMSRLYHTVRNEILFQMYLTSRSLGYWGLAPSASGLSTFINVSDPAAITHGTLSAANIALLTAFNSALENFGSSTPGSFPAAGQASGITVVFTKEEHPAVFEALKQHTPSSGNNAGYVHSVSIPVHLVQAHTLPAENPFYGRANVRISTARPWIVGAKTKGGALQVNLLHTGAEAFSDSSNNGLWFTHSPISATFAFTIADRGITNDSNGFGAVQGGTGGYYSNADFAPPGPFAMWKITIDPDFNDGLDMSGVNRIELEFRGAGHSFN